MTGRMWFFVVAAGSLVPVGCGGGATGGEPKSAIDEQRSDNERYGRREAELASKQASDPKAKQPSAPETMLQKHARDRAELGLGGMADPANAASAMDNTDDALRKDRKAFVAAVKRRLDQLDRRVNSIRSKTDKANAKLREQVSEEMREFSRRREEAVQRLNALSSVGVVDWDAAKHELNAKIGDLERIIDKLGERL